MLTSEYNRGAIMATTLVQGQRVRYFDEKYAMFSNVLAVARSTLPTDVIFNFGAWHHAAKMDAFRPPMHQVRYQVKRHMSAKQMLCPRRLFVTQNKVLAFLPTLLSWLHAGL